MKKFIFILSIYALFVACKNEGYSQLNVELVEYASGFNDPVAIRNAGDNRLFIVEQTGVIKIIDSNGNTLSTPFIDITNIVNSGASEQGLLGLAFHPDYLSNGYFFVNYTGAGDSTFISRFSRSSGNQNTADPLSELNLLAIRQPYKNHNGGDIAFGPDGYLYVGMGDGGSGGDPQNYAQNNLSMLGKMLRIDVDIASPYGIPLSNPFVGNSSYLPEIWATGLRNPWRFSFDRQTGDLWIGDVGQNSWEEINTQLQSSGGGENYGWRCYEAEDVYNLSLCDTSLNFQYPVHKYPNTGFLNDCSVTGGYVYRGSDFPVLNGHYFYADYCSNKLWSIADSAGTTKEYFHGNFSGNNFSSFGEDYRGELYVAGLSSGKIFRITDTTSGTGIGPNYYNTSINVFPNPFEDYLNVEISENQPVLISLVDMLGREIFNRKLDKGKSILDMSKVPPGMYHLVLTGSNFVRTKMLIRK